MKKHSLRKGKIQICAPQNYTLQFLTFDYFQNSRNSAI